MEQLTRNQVKHLRSLNQKKFREQTGEFLLEGLRLCEEALQSPLTLTEVIVELKQAQHPLVAQAQARGVEVHSASKMQFEQFCDSRTPQGFAVVAKIPRQKRLPTAEKSKMVLALDRLADPGNVGTILRSARWFGVETVLLGEGSVDVFSPKVVRSSMGAVCYLALHQPVNLQELTTDWQEQNGQIAVLSMAGNPLEKYSAPDSGLLLITGSEAHGVDPEIEKLGTPITISRRGSGESLNAGIATSIALWQLARPKS